MINKEESLASLKNHIEREMSILPDRVFSEVMIMHLGNVVKMEITLHSLSDELTDEEAKIKWEELEKKHFERFIK